jgi:hypothetical protein
MIITLRAKKLFVYISMAILALGMLRLVTWALQPSDVLVIKNSPFPTRTIREHPTANGVVFLQIDYCKKVQAEGRVRTSFVSDSREVFLPIAYDNQAPTCQNTEIPVKLPKDLPPDSYKVKYRVEYKVNPLKQREIEEFESKEFEVVAM